MGLITESGRAAMARAIKEQTMFLVLGRGESSWDSDMPADDGKATELVSEIGRKALTRSIYVTPNVEGDIEVPTSITEDGNGGYGVTTVKYSQSASPTRYIYVEFRLDFTDAVNQTIRELGLYVGSVLKDDLPSGQTWFTADNFDDEGLLFEIENRVPYIRTVNQRPVFSWVIAI